MRNLEVKGDSRPDRTEAPLFGAQASPGKGRVYAWGKKGGLCRGHQLAELLLLGPEGEQVPSRLPLWLIKRAVPGKMPWQTQRGVVGPHTTPTSNPGEDEPLKTSAGS